MKTRSLSAETKAGLNWRKFGQNGGNYVRWKLSPSMYLFSRMWMCAKHFAGIYFPEFSISRKSLSAEISPH